jgi:hypothetical protein
MQVIEVKDKGKVVGYKFGQFGKIYTIAEYKTPEAAKFKAILDANRKMKSNFMTGQ